jgi:hypothetical protein
LTDNYLYGVRRFPYSTNMTANPLTWADVDDLTISMAGGIPPSPLSQSQNGALEPTTRARSGRSASGRSQAWSSRAPAATMAAGNTTMLGIVTDAMKLTPVNPSFIDARTPLRRRLCRQRLRE